MSTYFGCCIFAVSIISLRFIRSKLLDCLCIFFFLEILEVAGEIGGEWKSLGIHLGYTSAKLNHLEDVYPRDPQWRNFMMIGEWCSVIASLHLNVKQYLAKFLSEAGQAHIADSLNTDYNS